MGSSEVSLACSMGDLGFGAAHAVDAGEMVHLKFPARLLRVYFSATRGAKSHREVLLGLRAYR